MAGRGLVAANVILGLVLAFAAWQVVCVGVSTAYARPDPQLALKWQANNQEALAALADHTLGASPHNTNQAASLAQAALRRNPGDVRALRVLAASADATGRHQKAAALLDLAGRRTWRDLTIDLMLVQDGINRSNVNEIAERADAILRVAPDTGPRLFPIVKQVVLNPAAQDAFGARLLSGPPWRRDFILALSADPNTSGIAFHFLNALQGTKNPPTEEETSGYLTKLVERKDFDKAYLSWILFLPPSETSAIQGLFNGGFENRRAPPPFNWDLLDRTGASVMIQPPPDGSGGSALFATYDGASRPPLARELLMLTPGRYHLEGRVYLGSELAKQRFAWTVICAYDNQPITQQPIDGAAGKWSTFGVDITITSQCGSQWLWLQTNPEVEHAQVQAWFDNLKLTQIGDPA